MKHYTDVIPESLALKLKEAGFDGRTTHLYKDGKLKKAARCDDWNSMTCFDYVAAPAYATVFDWFMNREIAISIISVFIGPHFVYDWEVYSPKFHESNDCYQDFDTCACHAIEQAIEILNK